MAQPIPLQGHWVYGPVASRRLGRSLGVNLLPTGRKLCSMRCVYCQYGDDLPPEGTPDALPDPSDALPEPDEVLVAVDRALAADPFVDAVTVAGNGEPTLHPAFEAIARGLADIRDARAPRAALVLLTNGARLDDAGVRAGMARFDRPFVKLDAGTGPLLAAVNRPRRLHLAGLLRGLRALPPERRWLQSLFCAGAVDTQTGPAIDAWLGVVAGLRPVLVHVTTVDRGTAVEGVLPVPAARLEEIAARARAAGVPCQAFPAR